MSLKKVLKNPEKAVEKWIRKRKRRWAKKVQDFANRIVGDD